MARNEGLHAAAEAPHHESTEDHSDDLRKAFEFVQSLAADLSRGHVDLPAYPDVALRVRQALGEEDVTNDQIARIIGSDAGLAARMLALANSAALSRGGRQFTDLKLAVTRVGHDTVRSAALAYALAQLRTAEQLRHIRDDLARLWTRSTLVAAIARVLAMHSRAANPDEAMLAGLLHNIGCVYMLARTDEHSTLFHNIEARDRLMRDWHANIGKAIAENWGLSDAIANAIGEQDATERLEAGRRDLQDVLFVAVRAADFQNQPDELEAALVHQQPFQRLALSGEELRTAMLESAEEIAGLRTALGD